MLTFAHTSFTDRLLIGLLALILNCVAMGPLSFYRKLNLSHPVMFVHWVILKLERKLNREKRSQAERRFRGFILFIVIVIMAVSSAYIISGVARHYLFPIPEMVMVAFLMPARLLFDRSLYVYESLKTHDLEASQQAVSSISRRATQATDEHGVARATIEHLAENFCDKVFAPLFWYLLLGLPGLFACKVINVMDGLIGHRSEKYAAFGMAAALGDDIANLVPARLAGFFIVVASIFVPGCRPFQSLHIMWRDADKLASPNSGWPMAAMAGALNLSLAGPRFSGGALIEDKWIGIGTAKATAFAVKRSLLLYAMSILLLTLSVAALSYI